MPRRQGHTKSTEPWKRRTYLSRNRRKELGRKREADKARNPKGG